MNQATSCCPSKRSNTGVCEQIRIQSYHYIKSHTQTYITPLGCLQIWWHFYKPRGWLVIMSRDKGNHEIEGEFSSWSTKFQSISSHGRAYVWGIVCFEIFVRFTQCCNYRLYGVVCNNYWLQFTRFVRQLIVAIIMMCRLILLLMYLRGTRFKIILHME